MTILNWINQNYEWIFSGIGVVAITGLIALMRRKKSSRKNPSVIINQKNNASEGTQIGIQNNNYRGENKNE